MSLLRRVARRAASSPSLARRLLGIRVPPIEPGRRYFDLTTPVLVRVVAPRLDPSSRVHDMGTGAYAAIGLALWRRTGCEVVASDVDAGLVEEARANVSANGAPIPVVQASYFDGIEGEFDAVTFNAPYVPSERVGGDGGDRRYAVQSEGGAQGTEVIDGFLAAFAAEARVDRAYLGVNTAMVPRALIEARIGSQNGLHLEEVLRIRPLPVAVFAIGHAPALGVGAGD